MALHISDRIVLRAVGDLVGYAGNARTHSAGQVGEIVASIREFGFTNPVLVDSDGVIIAGHCRVLAARALGMGEVPTIELGYLTDVQRRAYVIADNRLALNAGWDEDLLAAELAALRDEIDLTVLGFSDQDLAGLLDFGGGLTDPDEAPEVPVDPVSRLGDVWVLGRHRLVCGDSTASESVEKALNGVRPHLMVTDPPYGVNYSAGWRNAAMPQKNDPARGRDGAGRAVGKVVNDDRADWREAWELFPGDVAYVWHGPTFTAETQAALETAGLVIRTQIIWVKQQFVIGRGDYHPQHEPCWYAVRKGKTGHWCGDRKQATVWQIDKPIKSETGHSTQKPVECMKRPIENNSSPGQAVYDPFLGSGTTLIAGEMTGRVVHALELSPAYVDVSVERWQAYTGEAARLEGDDRSFAEIAAARRVDQGLAAAAAR